MTPASGLQADRHLHPEFRTHPVRARLGQLRIRSIDSLQRGHHTRLSYRIHDSNVFAHTFDGQARDPRLGMKLQRVDSSDMRAKGPEMLPLASSLPHLKCARTARLPQRLATTSVGPDD